MAELDELGKLFKAFEVKGNRDKFKAGTAVPGVNVGQIRQPTRVRLKGFSDEQLAFLAKVNADHLADGLAFPGHPGIAAV